MTATENTTSKLVFDTRSILRCGKSFFPEIIGSSVFINLFTIALPVYTMSVYDRVVNTFAVDTLLALTAGVFLALLFDFLFKLMRSSVAEGTGKRIAAQLEQRVFAQFMASPPDHWRGMSLGRRVYLFREVAIVVEFLLAKALPLILDLPFALIMLFVVYLMAGWVALVSATTATLILFIQLVLQPILAESIMKTDDMSKDKSRMLVEYMAGLESLQLANAQPMADTQWCNASNDGAAVEQRHQFWSAIATSGTAMLMQLTSVGVVFAGVFAIHYGDMTVGALIATTILSGRILAPIIGMGQFLPRWRAVKQSMKSLADFTDTPPSIKTAKPNHLAAVLQVDDIHFAYGEKQAPILRGCSFNVWPGEKIAIIGKSGCGKSTLLRLLAGLETSTEGYAAIDTHHIDRLDPVVLRNMVSTTLQTPHFFAGTVRDNITLGHPDISDEDAEKAVLSTGTAEVFATTGLGLDSPVLEMGVNLSGGQKKAVALARSMVRPHHIMLLDEPTEGMDTALEDSVRKHLQKHFITSKSTLILVTHRASMLSLVDRLLVLDKGKIIADGPRDEILAKMRGQSV